jgi:hypothetical protein
MPGMRVTGVQEFSKGSRHTGESRKVCRFHGQRIGLQRIVAKPRRTDLEGGNYPMPPRLFMGQEALMTHPDPHPKEPERNEAALWIVAGLMALIVIGGLTYGLSHPSMYSSNPPQTVGSAATHARSGHPM